MVVDLDLVAAGVLGVAHRGVGAVNDVRTTGVPACVEGSHADARRYSFLVWVGDVRVLQTHSEASGNVHGLAGVRVGEQDDELLSASAVEDVAVADGPSER